MRQTAFISLGWQDLEAAVVSIIIITPNTSNYQSLSDGRVLYINLTHLAFLDPPFKLNK